MKVHLVRIVLVGLFAVLFADLFWMQVIKGPEFTRQSENNRIRLVPEEASRGIIYDRNGVPLVENKLAFDVVAVPQEVNAAGNGRLFAELGKFLAIDSQALADTFAYNYDSGFSPVMLAADVPRETAFLIEQEMAQLSGVFIKTRAVRQYNYGKAMAHVLGYVGKMRDDEYPELKKYGYRLQDSIGRSGLEKSCDAALRGKSGGMQLEVNSRGNIIRVISYRPPVRGGDVHVTIDVQLQSLVGDALGDTRGAAAVMDADNGEVLALYSGPSYDPNIMVDRKRKAEINEMLSNPGAPFLNRAVNAYAPGSIFKIVTAYAGLNEQIITPAMTAFCTGEFTIGNATRSCWLKRGHDDVNVIQALTVSCNVFFWEYGLKIGERLLSLYAKEFGLGRTTDIELPGESAGVVPEARWKKMTLRQKWYGGDTVNFAIGQGYVSATPVQALRMVAFVANGGKEVSPHLVKKESVSLKNRKTLAKEPLAMIREGMYGVVNSPQGTGQRAAVAGSRTFAKTGTAQTGSNPPHAWFVGYTEAKSRNICFVVFLEHGGHGGEEAADIARRIIEYFQGARS